MARERKKGLAMPIGNPEEPRSWRKPGSVVSAVEQAPPICRLRSTTVVEIPAEASVIAAERPLGPEPMMVAVAIRSEKTDAEASSTRRNIANGLLLRHRLISSIRI